MLNFKKVTGGAPRLFVLAILSVLLPSCSSDPAAAAKDSALLQDDPCASVPKKMMNADAPDSVMRQDFGYLVACGLLDTFDLDFVVPGLIPQVLADEVAAGRDSIPYQLVVDRVREFHLRPEYALLRQRVRGLDSMRATVIDPARWTADTSYLSNLGMEKEAFAHLQNTVHELRQKKTRLTWAEALDSTDQRLQRSNR